MTDRLKIYIIFAVLTLIWVNPVLARGKLLDSTELAAKKRCYSIEEALKNPKDVYILDLTFNQLVGQSQGPLDGGSQQKLWRRTEISYLPNSIGTLTNLQELYLAYNRLTTLPDSIGYLKNLQTLDLAYNQLQKLPASINKLKKFRKNYSWRQSKIRLQ